MGEIDERLARMEETVEALTSEKVSAMSLGQWQLLPQTIFNGIMVILAAAGIIGLVQQSSIIGSMQTEITVDIKALDALTNRIDKAVAADTALAIDAAGVKALVMGQSEKLDRLQKADRRSSQR
jgi:hypothetical protein